MTKRQLIEEIITMNRTAQPEFLAGFQDSDLGEYLSHLRHARVSRLIGDSSRYARFFRDNVAVAIPACPVKTNIVPVDQYQHCSDYVTAQPSSGTASRHSEVANASRESGGAYLKTDVDTRKELSSAPGMPTAREAVLPESATVSISAGYNDPTQEDESPFAIKDERKWLF